jgi:hypothetical protein
MIRNTLRLVSACGLCLVLSVTLFLGLQALALLLPRDSAITTNLNRSLARGTLLPDNAHSPYGHTIDTVTDCAAFGTNLGNSDQSLLYRLAAAPNLASGDKDRPCPDLIAALREGAAKAFNPHFRYWHGHQVYLRPLLSITGLGKIHLINAVLLIGAFTLLCLRVRDWFGTPGAMGFAFAFLWTTDLVSVPLSSVHCLSLTWIFLSVAIAGRALEKDLQSLGSLVLVFWIGAVASFFDMMFNPPLAPTLIAFIAMRHALTREPSQENGLGFAAWYGGGCACLWFAGFGLAWAAKWAFAASVLGFNDVVPNVIGQIQTQSAGEEGARAGIFVATWAALAPHRDVLPLWWTLAGVLLWRARMRLHRGDLIRFALLLLPLLIPILWVEIVRRHSVIHSFVGRTFVLFCVLPALAAWTVTRRAHVSRDKLAHSDDAEVRQQSRSSD